jgi:hypothetical protein
MFKWEVYAEILDSKNGSKGMKPKNILLIRQEF